MLDLQEIFQDGVERKVAQPRPDRKSVLNVREASSQLQVTKRKSTGQLQLSTDDVTDPGSIQLDSFRAGLLSGFLGSDNQRFKRWLSDRNCAPWVPKVNPNLKPSIIIAAWKQRVSNNVGIAQVSDKSITIPGLILYITQCLPAQPKKLLIRKAHYQLSTSNPLNP